MLLLWLLFCVAHFAVELPPKPLSVDPEGTQSRTTLRRRQGGYLAPSRTDLVFRKAAQQHNPPKPLSERLVNPEPTRGTLAGRLRAKTRWLPSVCTFRKAAQQQSTVFK